MSSTFVLQPFFNCNVFSFNIVKHFNNNVFQRISTNYVNERLDIFFHWYNRRVKRHVIMHVMKMVVHVIKCTEWNMFRHYLSDPKAVFENHRFDRHFRAGPDVELLEHDYGPAQPPSRRNWNAHHHNRVTATCVLLEWTVVRTNPFLCQLIFDGCALSVNIIFISISSQQPDLQRSAKAPKSLPNKVVWCCSSLQVLRTALL